MNHKLTTESKIVDGITLYRIEAGADFKGVKKGEKGGWVEKIENVSGNAWVYGDAHVYGDAQVSGDAQVYGKLKLEAGWFFGVKWLREKVQEIEIENGNCLIGKGDIKLCTEEEKSLVGTEVEVKVDGKTYKARITE